MSESPVRQCACARGGGDGAARAQARQAWGARALLPVGWVEVGGSLRVGERGDRLLLAHAHERRRTVAQHDSPLLLDVFRQTRHSSPLVVVLVVEVGQQLDALRVGRHRAVVVLLLVRRVPRRLVLEQRCQQFVAHRAVGLARHVHPPMNSLSQFGAQPMSHLATSSSGFVGGPAWWRHLAPARCPAPTSRRR